MSENSNMEILSVRLTKGQSDILSRIVEKSGVPKSVVARQIFDAGLGDESKYVFTSPTVVSDEVKTLLFDCIKRIEAVSTALNKIGGNINKRRRDFNTERKTITDRISELERMSKHAESYERLSYKLEIDDLQKELKEFDQQERKMVSDDEWLRFESVKNDYREISIDIGRRFSGW